MTNTIIYEGAEETKQITTASYVNWHEHYLEVEYHPDAPEWMTAYDELQQYMRETKRIPLARVVEVQDND